MFSELPTLDSSDQRGTLVSITATLAIAIFIAWYLTPSDREQRSAADLRRESYSVVPRLVIPTEAIRLTEAPPLRVKAGAALRMGPYLAPIGVPLRWSFFVHEKDIEFAASFVPTSSGSSDEMTSTGGRVAAQVAVRTREMDCEFTPPSDGELWLSFNNKFSVLRAKFITLDCSELVRAVVGSTSSGSGAESSEGVAAAVPPSGAEGEEGSRAAASPIMPDSPTSRKFSRRVPLRRVTSFISTPAKWAGAIDASATTTTAAPLVVDASLLLADAVPLLVFVNSRSGGGEGKAWHREFSRCLHPLQVWDLADRRPPHAALMPFKEMLRAGRQVRLLAVGGDGTVAWVLSLFETWAQRHALPLAILPMGTGNDISRTLGWGPGHVARDPLAVLRAINAAEPALFDRWQIKIKERGKGGKTDGQGKAPRKGKGKGKGKRKGKGSAAAAVKDVVMNAYCGLGCGAKVALHFHRQRERCPCLFSSRAINMVWYSKAGFVETLHSAGDTLNPEHNSFASSIQITVDGKAVEIGRDIQGIIVLNIPSYGAGLNLWENATSPDGRGGASGGEGGGGGGGGWYDGGAGGDSSGWYDGDAGGALVYIFPPMIEVSLTVSPLYIQ